MKFIKQLSVIIIISFIGEVLNRIIPLPVPASIYGLVLMFCALKFKVFPLEAVKETGTFLTGIMTLLFVPATVGFMNAFPVLKEYGILFFMIATVSTFLVMIVTGHVTQFIMRLSHKNDDGADCKTAAASGKTQSTPGNATEASVKTPASSIDAAAASSINAQADSNCSDGGK